MTLQVLVARMKISTSNYKLPKLKYFIFQETLISAIAIISEQVSGVSLKQVEKLKYFRSCIFN